MDPMAVAWRPPPRCGLDSARVSPLLMEGTKGSH
ncbi:hypothetical protein CGLO_10292 [Colletotrichum gloeosporioides Cg-14]|uniref:Uncharacterized protein n=1 Tax=Colletotrichum gloeosporioides (strain Cg-14) TaxID=1237896 RepID=T0K3S2_COLGC|nr:hypothetical protein CGLO_10292 [Colletotrichum gloeosporioides Cg-14]